MANSQDLPSLCAPAAEQTGKVRDAVPVGYEYSTNLPAVLERLDLSIVVSTYQAGKLITIGSHQGKLVFGFAGFAQVMGVSRTPTGLAIGGKETVWSLPASREIAPALEPTGQHDVAVLTRQAHFTGPVLGHDLAYGNGQLWLVNTAFKRIRPSRCTAGSNHRPDYPRRPFRSQKEACLWACAFVDWYNHQHRHSAIRFGTPHQRPSGQGNEICRHRSRVYEQARQRHPRRWTRSTRCWRQPEVVWINPPPAESDVEAATLAMAA